MMALRRRGRKVNYKENSVVSSKRAFQLNRVWLIAAIIALLATQLALAGPRAYAATFTVTTLADSGTGSLREAVSLANSSGGADTIEFDLELVPGPHVITLTSGELAVTENLTITGPGDGSVTISGENTSRMFVVNSASVTLTLERLKLTGGNGAGSIVNGWGGAIFISAGHLELSETEIYGNVGSFGGAIHLTGLSTASVRLDRSTIRNNTGASQAGGIMVANGDVYLLNSTVSHNSVTGQGGGIAVVGPTSAATILMSTIAFNTATSFGGGIYHNGDTTATGVRSFGSIFAANAATAGDPNVHVEASRQFTSLGYSILATSTGTVNAGTGDSAANPLLEEAADNGGLTQTNALGESSPAIDAIPDGACEDPISTDPILEDQRGVERPQRESCDIGAFEAEEARDGLQACLFAGSLSQVNFLPNGEATTINCARGELITLYQGTDYIACLYAGSLSQVKTSGSVNCGRGVEIGLAAGDDYHACLFSGSLSQVGTSIPSSCGRGAPVSFEAGPPVVI